MFQFKTFQNPCIFSSTSLQRCLFHFSCPTSWKPTRKNLKNKSDTDFTTLEDTPKKWKRELEASLLEIDMTTPCFLYWTNDRIVKLDHTKLWYDHASLLVSEWLFECVWLLLNVCFCDELSWSVLNLGRKFSSLDPLYLFSSISILNLSLNSNKM